MEASLIEKIARAMFGADTGDASNEGWLDCNRDRYERMARQALRTVVKFLANEERERGSHD